MRENGTDRDIAQAFVSVVNDLATLLGTLNDNLFVPHIVTQPTNQTAAVGSNAVFTVVANNVIEYKWQYRGSGATTWRDINPGEITGFDTATLTVPASETRYTFTYSCRMVGKDGSAIRTALVKILEPEPEPEG